MLSLNGCSSVSQKEYDAKTKELTELQEKYDKKVNELEKSLSESQKEVANLKDEVVQKGFSESGAKAWAAESFGDDAQVIINGNDLYINLATGYTVSEKSIEALWNKIVNALTLYSNYYKIAPDNLPYDSVTIFVLEENTGLDMLSFQFLKSESSDTFEQNSIMINFYDIQTIVQYLQKAMN